MLSLLVAFSMYLPVVQANSVDEGNQLIEVKDAIQGVSALMLENGVVSEWEAIGLAKAGVPVPPSYLSEFESNLKGQVLDKTGTGSLKVTDVERLAIAAAAIGVDARNADGNGFSLIDKIHTSEHWTWENTDSIIYQGNNGIIFALIALDSKGYSVPDNAKWTREKLVAELLKYQKDDGSWSLSTSTTAATSFDITAMALTSLAPYTDNSVVKDAVNKAVAFLSNAQGLSGGFSEEFVGGISSEATSQVIIGLTSNGIDPRSEQFTKNGINLIDHLLSFKADDGGFKHTSNEIISNGMATEQALQGLVAFDLFVEDKGRLYEFGQETLPEPEPTPEKPESIQAPKHVETTFENGKLQIYIKDEITGVFKPVRVENSQTMGGYFIVKIRANKDDEVGNVSAIKLPPGENKIVIIEDDAPYSYMQSQDDKDAKTSPTHEWKVHFSQPFLNEASNLAKVTVQDASGNNVEIERSLSDDEKTVMITPNNPYNEGELYYLTIANAKSANGKTLTTSVRKIFIIN